MFKNILLRCIHLSKLSILLCLEFMFSCYPPRVFFAVERTLLLMNVVSSAINNYKIDEKVMNNIMELCSKLKIYGPQIDNQLYQSEYIYSFIYFY